MGLKQGRNNIKHINFEKNIMSPFNTKLKSVLLIKCPRCHKGRFLKHSAYDFSSFVSVRKKCDHCKLNYHLEPSFYTGSMYVAYALGVALMLLVIGGNYLLFPTFSFLRSFWSIFILLLLLSPYLNALSKIIWANLFIKFDPKK